MHNEAFDHILEEIVSLERRSAECRKMYDESPKADAVRNARLSGKRMAYDHSASLMRNALGRAESIEAAAQNEDVGRHQEAILLLRRILEWAEDSGEMQMQVTADKIREFLDNEKISQATQDHKLMNGLRNLGLVRETPK